MINEKDYKELLRQSHLLKMERFTKMQQEIAAQRKQAVAEYKAARKRIYEESNKPTPESWVKRQHHFAHDLHRILTGALSGLDYNKHHFEELPKNEGNINFAMDEDSCFFTIKFNLLKFEQK